MGNQTKRWHKGSQKRTERMKNNQMKKWCPQTCLKDSVLLRSIWTFQRDKKRNQMKTARDQRHQTQWSSLMMKRQKIHSIITQRPRMICWDRSKREKRSKELQVVKSFVPQTLTPILSIHRRFLAFQTFIRLSPPKQHPPQDCVTSILNVICAIPTLNKEYQIQNSMMISVFNRHPLQTSRRPSQQWQHPSISLIQSLFATIHVFPPTISCKSFPISRSKRPQSQPKSASVGTNSFGMASQRLISLISDHHSLSLIGVVLFQQPSRVATAFVVSRCIPSLQTNTSLD